MAIRNSWETENRTYSAVELVSRAEEELSTILFICGLDGSNVDAYEIDDVVEAIRNSFCSGTDTAANMILDKWSRQLLLVTRRNTRWRRIANYARDNGY